MFGSFDALSKDAEKLKVSSAVAELHSRRLEIAVERARELFKRQKLLAKRERALRKKLPPLPAGPTGPGGEETSAAPDGGSCDVACEPRLEAGAPRAAPPSSEIANNGATGNPDQIGDSVIGEEARTVGGVGIGEHGGDGDERAEVVGCSVTVSEHGGLSSRSFAEEVREQDGGGDAN